MGKMHFSAMPMLLFFLWAINVDAAPTTSGPCQFQFTNPTYPSFDLPPPESNDQDDMLLNPNNPIQRSNGAPLTEKCKSGKLSYQTEDGDFSSTYIDSKGHSSSIKNLFYVRNSVELRVHRIHSDDENLESFLTGKELRLEFTCKGEQTSCVRFTVGPPTTTMADSGCFSKDENVTMADFRSIPIGDVKTGDLVWTTSGDGRQMQLSEVMMVSHVAPNDKTHFYTVETITGHRLSLTGNHYIQVPDHGYLQAKHLSTNHSLYVTMNDRTIRAARIRTIKSEMKTGIYNLFTVHGTYLVNGIAASSYVNITHFSHEETHHIVAPLRWAYSFSKLFRGFQGLYPVEETTRQGLIQILKKHFDALVFFNYARNVLSTISITLLAASSFAIVSGMVNKKSFSNKLFLEKKIQ